MNAPNILLITVDCLRADHMSCYGYDRETTPNIDDLCKISTLYQNHMSNGPTTPNSFPGIMSSRYRLEMPGLMLPRKWSTIAEMLSESGYHTVGMSSMNPWTSRYFGYQRGFDEFNDYMRNADPDNMFGIDKWGRVTWFAKHLYDIIGDAMERNQIQDIQFANDATEMSEKLKGKEPWFFWAHYMDTHTDYFPKKMYYGKKRLRMSWYVNLLNKLVTIDKHINLNVRKDIIDLYDSAVRQVDEHIRDVLSNVPDIDNTMVIITSDHGEGFEEHGHWAHQHYSMYEELLKVPLIIHYPGGFEPDIISESTSSVDILPTIAGVADSFLPSIVRGSDLRDVIPGSDRPIFHEGLHVRSLKVKKINIPRTRGVTMDGKRLVMGFNPPTTRLFDIKTDPDEKNNLIDNDDHKETKDRLTGILNSMMDDERKTISLETGVALQ